MNGTWSDSFTPLARVWSQNAAALRSKPALISPAETVDWATLGDRMDRIAGGLLDAGLQPGDRVLLLAHGSITAVETLMGLLRAGLVAVPLSPPLLTPDQARIAAEDAGASSAIATAPFAEHAAGFVLAGPRLAEGFSLSGWQDFAAWRDAAPAIVDTWRAQDDPAMIIYSSGTTGAPKGIVHAQAGRWMFSAGLGLALGIDRTSVALLTTPVSSNATGILLFPALLVGGTIVIVPKFDAATVLQAMEKHQVSHVFAVPTAIERMVDLSDSFPRGLLRCLA